MKDFNDNELILQNIRDSAAEYICLSCFDTRDRKIKRRDILRAPRRTWLDSICDRCTYNRKHVCTACPQGDTLSGRDYEYIPVSHLCALGRRNKNNELRSMSELVCPVCKRPIHRIIGRNIIISIVGSRDSGKSHYIGVLLHELVGRLGRDMGWTVVPEDNTAALYETVFSRIYSACQTLSLTDKNHDGFYEPYIYYITDSKGETFTMTFFDTAGEDFESDDLVENAAEHTFHADGIIFLIDPLKIMNVNARLDEETVRSSSGVSINKTFKNDAILSIMSTALRRHLGVRDSKRIPVNLAVTVPKIDVVAGEFPPHYAVKYDSTHARKQGFFEAESRRVSVEVRKWLYSLDDGQLNSFLAQLEINYSNYVFFGVSALGWNNSPDRNGVFTQPKPHRVEDPLMWILCRCGMIPEI